jgi:hypothetical protein
LSKTVEEKQIDKLQITRLVNVGCVHIVFDCKELVSWCARRFNSRTRIIKLTTKGKNPVQQNPKAFNIILRLPIANKHFKIVEAYMFLASQAEGVNILGEFLLLSTNMPRELSTLDITLLQDPYRDFSWLFTRVTG